MIAWKYRIAVTLSCLVFAAVVPLTSADEAGDAAPGPAAIEAPPDSAADDSILSLVFDSGVIGLLFMGALGLFSLVSVTVAIERLVNTRRECIVSDDFVSGLKQVVDEEKSTPADLKAVCENHKSPAATILLAGVLRTGRPLPEIEKAMEDAAAREMAAFRSRVRPLTVAGSVAPLIGLLGTVVGMIIAFRTASQAGLGKGEMLAQGIYMALVTTAAGLSIAIPSLLCASFFNGRIERFFRVIDEILMTTFPCFARIEARSAIESQSLNTGDAESDRDVDKLVRMK